MVTSQGWSNTEVVDEEVHSRVDTDRPNRKEKSKVPLSNRTLESREYLGCF